MSVKNKGRFNFSMDKFKEKLREEKNFKWAVIGLGGMILVTIFTLII